MNELEQANQAISIQNDDDDDFLLNNTFDNFFSSHTLNNNATLSPEESPAVTPKSPKNKKKRNCKEKLKPAKKIKLNK